VLERVRAAGLKLHPAKCYFMQREVSFLGHTVGGVGISTLKDTVQAVADWPTSTNQKQLKSFLGLASYYALFQLLQKDRDWTEQYHEAFSLQRALCGAPLLAPVDPTLPFILDTDASGVGWEVCSHKRGQRGSV